MGLTEYEIRQLLYYHYNDLKPFTGEDILRKAKMSLNRNATREEVERFLGKLRKNQELSEDDGKMQLSSKLVRSKCTSCTFVFYLVNSQKCPNCGNELRVLQ